MILASDRQNATIVAMDSDCVPEVGMAVSIEQLRKTPPYMKGPTRNSDLST
jgi:hypothetical protein